MTTTSAAARLVAAPPAHGLLAWRLVQRNVLSGRRNWLLVVSGFFEPVFYLLGLGVGVGALVGGVEVDGRTVSYREFVAPAMLAAAAMYGAVYESTINVFAKLKFARTYEGVLATPLRVRDVALGELVYALMRGALYATGFMVVMLALGLVESPWAVAAVPAALLVGAAFGGVGLVAVTFVRSWADTEFVNVVTLPLFLFSATFIPLASYPESIRWVLPLTPLYHGVELLRGLTLGMVGPGLLLHAAYLLAMGAAGLVVADRRLERLLLK
ncbi:MAG: ABC transporter permease [Thermoleophilia bacterium]|nr:ABC transporter permease [Thermoleophilia bacterium]